MARIKYVAGTMDFEAFKSLTEIVLSISRLVRDLGDAGNTDPQLGEMSGKVVEMNTLVIDIQAKALSLQDEVASQRQRIRELEEELVRAKDHREDLERYVKIEVGGEAFVYALKKGMEKAEPPHWLCCTCYEKGQKSTLQKWGTPMYYPNDTAWDCPNCNHRIVVSKTRTPAVQDFFFRRTT